VAELPVPGRPGADAGLRDGAELILSLPDGPRAALRTLRDAGHEAVLVGGCVRDTLLGVPFTDWDVATSAAPAAVSRLLTGSSWENRFGTVTVPTPQRVEITTYRTEGRYSDRRRPDTVRFVGSLGEDLARRDFTVNAIAWRPTDLERGVGVLVDPHGGVADIRDGRIRAVGVAAERFDEDALRLLRAVRFSLRLGFEIDAETERAIVAAAPHAASLSGERVRAELDLILSSPTVLPSLALGRWEELGLLRVLLPELAALRGVPQAKRVPGDALDHSLRTADALPHTDPVLRVAGLLHDLGKASTAAGGHFTGHERVGADAAAAVMRRLRYSSADTARVRTIVREHMFGYDGSWTDAAVRRLVARVGRDRLEDLLALRDADVAASDGSDAAGYPGTAALRRRIAAQRDAPVSPLQLAIDGRDLQRELGIAPGPAIGRVKRRLLEAVLDDPALNERTALLAIAREEIAASALTSDGGRDRGSGQIPEG
jgi:tRNA nucleotidyltransferase (CCA-adding enzyme)